MSKHIIMMLAIVMSLILSHSNAQVPFTRPKQWMQCSDKLCQIHIKNQPLAQFIHAFSIQTKLPIQLITSQSLKINLNLNHLSPMQCLYHLCQHYHLHYKKLPHTLIIWAQTIAKPHNEPQPFMIKQIQIAHMNAADMAKKIAMRAPHALTQCVSYYPLPKENQIRIKAKAKALDDLMQWIHANDQLPKQIALHTLLFSSNADQQHALGFTTTENGPLSGLLNNISKHSMPWLHTLPALSPSQLKVALDLLESKGMGMMVAQPQLITCDQQTALLEAGSEIPMKRYHKEIEEIHFKQLMLSLALTPHYQTDGYMALHIKLHEQRPGNINAQGIPGIITHHLVTNIHVANKQTIAIGGLSTTDYMNHKSCIPILHHLPVLGPLFCHTQRTQHKAQLWIFITPEILNNANTPYHSKSLPSPRKHIADHTK